ncbi:MAG: choice-of-anchor X domain-containing protein [Rudaea sp.]
MRSIFFNHALAAAVVLFASPAAVVGATAPQNLGYGLDKLVESHQIVKQHPERAAFGGFATEEAQTYASQAIAEADSGRLTVDILPSGRMNFDTMQKQLLADVPSLTILAVDANYRSTGIVEAYVDIDDVTTLAKLSGVRSVFLALRPDNDASASTNPTPSVVPGQVLNALGSAFDQGVTQHRVDRINQFYNPSAAVNYDGAGISVAVISDSFATRPGSPSAVADVLSFDLPGAPTNPLNTTQVFVLRDLGTAGTDEGRGMAQIVYKMAPRARIGFASGSLGEVQFANDIRTLASGATQGSTTFKADVIADDLSYSGEPFYGETIIGNAIDDATALGVSYFSSAGNNVGTNAYESALRIVPDASGGGFVMTAAAGNTALAGTNIDLTGVSYSLYAGGFHNFNPASGQLDVAQLVNMPSGTTANTEMQWDDPYDQRPIQPAVPPVFTASGTIGTVGGSVTYSSASSPALPVLTEGTRYVIQETATAGGLNGKVTVLDAANNVLLTQNGLVDENVIFVAPTTGNYQIKIEGVSNSTGSFGLTVSVPFYANSGSIGGLVHTVPFNEASSPPLPHFVAGTPYIIQETAVSGDFDGIVTIRDSLNNIVVSQDTGTDETLTFYAPTSGQYQIEITAFSSTTGDFHVIVTQASGSAGVTTDLNLLAFTTTGAYISTRSLTTNNITNNRPVELGNVRPTSGTQMQFVIARGNIPTAPQLPTRVRWSTRGNGASGIGPAEYFTYNTVTTKGHATAKGCNGTAAYSVFRANLPESYTSPGPATILFDKNANRLATPDVRRVPVVAAADVGNTSSFGTDSLSDFDNSPNFAGTSAAAPHAAAIAALVLQSRGGPGSVTPAQMRTILTSNVFPHDLDPSFASGLAGTTDGATVALSILSDNDSNVQTGLNDPNSITVSYTGPGSLQSLTFNPQGTAANGGNTSGGRNGVTGSSPLVYFDVATPGTIFRPSQKPFTLGTLTGLLPADIGTATFTNSAPSPASGTDVWTMGLTFPTGNFGNGKVLRFTVGRGVASSSSSSATTSPVADLFGGGVLIPSGLTIAEGMTFSGTTTAGGTFSGRIKNAIGYGYTVVDGWGFIDAAAATGVGTTILVSSGAANPVTGLVGAPVLLTVTVTPGASPTSAGLYVAANLEGIGGSAQQMLFDDGTNGDAVAGDHVFSFATTVAASATVGSKSMPAVVSDLQGRGGNTLINVTVSSPVTTGPTGAGLAMPNSVNEGSTTVLSITVTPGSNPVSNSLAVTANLTAIGGGASQTFYDDGSHGDQIAGDGIFTFTAAVSLHASPGSITLTATITDGQSRSAPASIGLNVTDFIFRSAFGD